MPFFIYSSVDRNGALIRSRGRYESIDALANELAERDEMIYSVYSMPDSVDKLSQLLHSKPKPVDVAEFCHYMAMYISGGLDIQSAVIDLAETTISRPLKRALLEVHRLLSAGYPISESLRRTGAFPELVVSMAQIGEESGEMDRMMRDAGDHIERTLAIKSAVKRALLYPTFALIVLVAGMLFWLTFVVPQLSGLFDSMDMELPRQTLILLAASAWTMENWLALLVGTVLFFILFGVLYRQVSAVRLGSDAVAWKLPVIGQVVQGSQKAFYFQYLSLMYGAGIVVTSALDTVHGAVSNSYFRRKLGPVDGYLRAGESISQAFSQVQGVFEPIALRMISIGEQTGNLEGQLKKLADLYFKRVQALVDVLGKMIEPIIIILIGILFAVFVLALIGPIYELVAQVGAGGF